MLVGIVECGNAGAGFVWRGVARLYDNRAGFKQNLIERVFRQLQFEENENLANIPLFEVY